MIVVDRKGRILLRKPPIALQLDTQNPIYIGPRNIVAFFRKYDKERLKELRKPPSKRKPPR